MNEPMHPNKWTREDVFDLSDRLLFESHKSGHPEKLRQLLYDAGSVLLNREIVICQIRNEIGEK